MSLATHAAHSGVCQVRLFFFGVFLFKVFCMRRMEETVRAMLAFKKQAEQLRQEKAALTMAFEVSAATALLS